MLSINYFLVLSSFLFCIGITVVLTKKQLVAILMGIELMLNAANINLVAFSSYDTTLKGQVFALFVIVIATAETVVGLAIAYKIYEKIHTTIPNKLTQLSEENES